MRTFALISSLAFATALSASVLAQDKAATPSAAAAAPAAASQAAIECRASMRPHDHGAERYMPRPISRDCAATPRPASKTEPQGKTGPLHDHGRVHKTQ